MIVCVGGDSVEVLVLVRINGEELDSSFPIPFLGLEQRRQVKVGDRAIGAEEDKNRGLVAFEPVEASGTTAKITQSTDVGNPGTHGDLFLGRPCPLACSHQQ
jgi:hypothetical protein